MIDNIKKLCKDELVSKICAKMIERSNNGTIEYGNTCVLQINLYFNGLKIHRKKWQMP